MPRDGVSPVYGASCLVQGGLRGSATTGNYEERIARETLWPCGVELTPALRGNGVRWHGRL